MARPAVQLIPGSAQGRGNVPRTEVVIGGEPVGYFIEEHDELAYDAPEVMATFYSAKWPQDTVVVVSREDAIAWLVEMHGHRDAV